jgi:hypothetical protein
MAARHRRTRWRGQARALLWAGLPAIASILHLGVRLMTERPGPLRERIRAEVLTWPGVTEHRHRFGGVEFRLGRRELGHLHGNHLADLPFPVRVREELVRDGRAQPHHILPASGWVSYPMHGEADLPGALALFRLAYDRAIAAPEKRQSSAATEPQRSSS